MQANVGRETKAERLLRLVLKRAGLRFERERRPEPSLRCTADVVLRHAKACIFVDGCFWHGCKRHFATPRSHSTWWAEKIAANVERDRRQTRLLRERGWTVIRLWEHQVSEEAVLRLAARLDKSGLGPRWSGVRQLAGGAALYTWATLVRR